MKQVADAFRARYNLQAKIIRAQWLVIALLIAAFVLTLVQYVLLKEDQTPADFTQGSNTVLQENGNQPSMIPVLDTLAYEAEETSSVAHHLVSLGEYKLTAYCACKKCCDKEPTDPNYGITAYGYQATAGRTIAVDPKLIPIGTEVIINGHTYVTEDVGGAIKENRIDIYFNTHQEALDFGVQYADVYINQ